MPLSQITSQSFKQNINVLCIGDIMLDSFVYGTVDRISPEAPVPIIKTNKTKTMLGGAGNVAINLHDLSCHVTLLSTIGNDSEASRIQEILNTYSNIKSYLCIDPSRCTTTKTRYVANNQQLIRVDNEDTASIPTAVENYFKTFLDQFGETFDIVVVADYNKGLLTQGLKDIIRMLENPITIIDTKCQYIDLYFNSNVVVPNLKELQTFSNSHVVTIEDIEYEASKLIGGAGSGFDFALVTLGAQGMLAKTFNQTQCIPALNSNPVDVSGCGDTVVAALALALGSKYDYFNSAKIANIAASIVVEKQGTASLTLEELVNKIQQIQNDN